MFENFGLAAHTESPRWGRLYGSVCDHSEHQTYQGMSLQISSLTLTDGQRTIEG